VTVSDADERPEVRELRLVVTAEDYDEALRFYRDVLGLRERAAFTSPGGRVTILEAGRATLELTDPPTPRSSTRSRSGAASPATSASPSRSTTRARTTAELAAHGATVIAEPTRTPWNSLNARLEAPGGLQLTLFTELGANA